MTEFEVTIRLIDYTDNFDHEDKLIKELLEEELEHFDPKVLSIKWKN